MSNKPLPFHRNDEGMNTIINGTPYNIRSDHSKYATLLRAVKEGDVETFLANCTEEKAIQSYISSSPVLNGKVQLKDGEVTYNGRVVHSSLTKRILEWKAMDLPFEHLLKFMEKLYQNPSSKAVNDLFDFLENRNIPITPEGNFLAYKGVQSNYYSCTAGKLQLLKGKVDAHGHVYNGIGEEIECARNEVDDNRDNECSYGLHVGGLEYSGPGRFGSITVIVEVNPADVIAVPRDYNAQKARVCHYTVISDFKQALPSQSSTQSEDCQSNCGCYRSEEDEEYVNTYDEDDECDNEDEQDYVDDEEYQYEGMLVTVEQVRPHDEISFVYDNEERFLSVERTDNGIVHGTLIDDDPNYTSFSTSYRNFKKNLMSDIYVLN